MSKEESKSIIKLYKDIFGRIDSDWKSLLYPIAVDIEEMALEKPRACDPLHRRCLNPR